MNILFFYRIYPEYGGVETVTTVLANRFVKDGHNVVVASIEQPHMELMEDLDKRASLVKLKYPVTCSANVRKLHEIIENHKIDVIINQWGLPFKTTVLCNRAMKNTDCKLISVLHGSPYVSKVILKAQDRVKLSKNILQRSVNTLLLRVKDEIIRRSIKYNVAHCSRYVLLSESFKKPFFDYARLKKHSNVVAIGNPITIETDYAHINLEEKEKKILYAGRMDYENKRVNRILEAWNTICREYPDWGLVLVGDGPHKKVLEQYVKDECVPRVEFYGFQKDPLIPFYRKASIYMLTSDLEGFGLAILESMSYGAVPIVYGSYESVYDIIENEISGFITPRPYSLDATVDRLKILLNDEKRRNRMAVAAIEQSKKFTIDSIVEKWYGLFGLVLGRQK